jgi:hypothetical protein
MRRRHASRSNNSNNNSHRHRAKTVADMPTTADLILSADRCSTTTREMIIDNAESLIDISEIVQGSKLIVDASRHRLASHTHLTLR